MGLSQPWGLELDLAHKWELAEPQNDGDARAQHVCKACRAAAGEEGSAPGGVFLEGGGLGIVRAFSGWMLGSHQWGCLGGQQLGCQGRG